MIRRLIPLLLLLSAVANAQHAQHAVDTSSLFDFDWSKRYAALQKILASPSALDSDEVKEALIECLEREDKILEESTPTSELADNETYGDNYLSALSDAVMHIAQSSNNQRAFDALAKSGYNPDSQLGVALAGRVENLPALLQAAGSHSLGMRSEAVGVIGMMLRDFKAGKVGPIAPEAYRRAKDTLTHAAVSKTEDAFVRRAAIDALGTVGDPEDLPLLQRIAMSDPEIAFDAEGKRRFPTRDEALKSIEHIRGAATLAR